MVAKVHLFEDTKNFSPNKKLIFHGDFVILQPIV